MNVENHSKTGEFNDIMFAHHFIPVINKPTRVRDKSATLIDNIFTNNIETDSVQGIFYTDITDHFPIFYGCPSFHIESQPRYVTKRIYSDANIRKFNDLLQSYDWNQVYEINDTQSAYSLFHEKFQQAYLQSFPMKTFKINYRNRKPWLTNALKNCIKKKNKLYVKNKRYPTTNTELIYKRYKKYLNSILYKAEQSHYENLFNSYKSNMKKSWELIVEIINRKSSKKTSKGKFTSSDGVPLRGKDVADNFNDFFVNVGPTLASKIPNTNVDPLAYMKSRNDYSIFLELVNVDEVNDIIKELRNASPGWDEIHAKVVKKIYHHIVEPLTYLCNLSILQGCVPKELKVAKVIPLYKADSPSIYTNYRPVSVLTCFSKIFERLMYNRLLTFVIQHGLLNKHQFGFRKGHSTIFAILSLVDYITQALEKGEYVIGIFLDFSKAFDTVNHSILLEKLQYMGIRGVAYDWLCDYLSERKQYVMYNGHKSDAKSICCGVPQGSILGPLLFLLYINDIANVSTVLFSILFADDTNSLASGKNLDQLVHTVNNELEKIVTWLAANKLSLNIKKTHFMLFASKGKKVHNPVTIKISNQEISKVNHTKFLEVIIDDKMHWSFHIKSAKNKIAKGIGVICKTRRLLNKKTLTTLYYSFIYPYLHYGIEAWGNTYNVHLDPLIKMQKRAVRIISSSSYKAHTEPIFKDLKLLNVTNIYRLNVLMFMYKLKHGILPNVFGGIFKKNSEIHDYNTKESQKYHTPFWRLQCVRRSIRVQGVYYWNYISDKIDYACTPETFKIHIKTFLLSNNVDIA